MSSQGIYGRNIDKTKDTTLYYFVRADSWFYYEPTFKVHKADHKFRGNPDLSLVAPIILARFNYDE